MVAKAKTSLKSKPYARLYALGEIRFRAICNELAQSNGKPYMVAKKIQQEWKAYLDVSEMVLGQQLNRFKKDLIAGKLPDVAMLLTDTFIKKKEILSEAIKAQEEISGVKIDYTNPLNILEELNMLVAQQKARLEMALEREKEMKMPISQTDGIIKNLRDTLIETQRIKFEIGVDTFMMPIAGRPNMSTTVVTPEGTVVNMQVTEAVNQASSILSGLASRGVLPKLQQEHEVSDAD